MASGATFVAYIDEAGDEGFKFGKGSSEWFVRGAAILRRATEMPEIKLIDDVRARLNRGRKPDRQFPARKALHFRDLEHDVRKYYAARIAQADLTTAVVLIKKRDMLFEDGNAIEEKDRQAALYHAATLCLIEAISHHCSETYITGEAGDGSVDLVFSSRSTLDYAQLAETIKLALADSDAFGHRAFMMTTTHPSADVIKPSQVQAIMHSKSMGLQIADAVTSSYYYRHSDELFGHGINAQFCRKNTKAEIRNELTRWQR